MLYWSYETLWIVFVQSFARPSAQDSLKTLQSGELFVEFLSFICREGTDSRFHLVCCVCRWIFFLLVFLRVAIIHHFFYGGLAYLGFGFWFFSHFPFARATGFFVHLARAAAGQMSTLFAMETTSFR